LTLLEGSIQQATCRTDEWMAFDVLHVAWLLADHHDLGMPGAFTENRLCGPRMEIACPAARRRVPHG